MYIINYKICLTLKLLFYILWTEKKALLCIAEVNKGNGSGNLENVALKEE